MALTVAATVLANWLPGGKQKGAEWVARNPTRSDKSPGSFSANMHTGAWGDFASGSKGGDLVSLVAYVDGCSQVEAARRLAKFLGMATDEAPASMPATHQKPTKPDAAEGVPVSPVPADAPAVPTRHPKHGKPSKVWIYRDASGLELVRILRFDRATGKLVLPLSLWTIGGALAWKWKALPTPRPLYGLDRLAERGGADVLVCEGEKAADAAGELLPGFVPVASPNGSQSADKADFGPVRGRKVYVWPDADEAGAGYAADVVRLAYAAGARSVSVLKLDVLAAHRGSPLPAGWDAADAKAEGMDPEALARVFDAPGTWSEQARVVSLKAVAEKARGPARSRFFLVTPEDTKGRRAGVYFVPVGNDKATGEPVEGEPQWICSPMTVEALTRDANGGEWGRLLVFKDRDGTEHRWAMPMTMLARNGDEMREHLLSQGLEITSDANRRRRLGEYISSADPEAFARCVARTGWHGGAFVLPDRTIGGSLVEPLILQSATPDGAKLGAAGTLAEWQRRVSIPCAGNSRLVLAISMAFGATCLGLVGSEGGGVHLKGASSAGKSTALGVAASVCGPAGYRREWRQTDNALEAVAAMHSDLLLPLDEIGTLAAVHASSVAYLLSNGQGKARANRDGSPRRISTWLLLFLSCGEIGLADLIAEAGGRHRAGMEVRTIDMPADPGKGLGLFEVLPEGMTAGVFADHLRRASSEVYGVALLAFLEAVVLHQDDARKFIASAVERFTDEQVGQGASGQVRRVAARFGLIAAAGELASHWGVTGWPKGEARSCLARCFKDWLSARGTAGASEPLAMLRQVQHFLELHGEARFAGWDRGEDDRAPRTLMRVGWRKKSDTGTEFLIFAESFRREVCAGFDPTAVARVLLQVGALRPESDTCLTRRERCPDKSMQRCYRVDSSVFEAVL